jgi:hypothetical protein
MLGVPAAVVVLAGLPALIGSSAPAPSAAPAQPAAQAALAVELSGAQGSRSQPYVIELRAPGVPPTRAAILRDATGQHTGEAIPVTGPCRPNSTPVAFETGEAAWCLRLQDVAVGHELSGTVQDLSGNALTLTVRRRDSFWLVPAVVLLCGLLVGLLAALVPAWLRGHVRGLVLERLLAANDTAQEGARIDGLRDWVVDRERDGQDREAIISAVDRVIAHGPELARLARVGLSLAIDIAAAGGELPEALKVHAQRRAAPGSPSMDEFYASDGSRLGEHPAALWRRAIERAAEIRDELAGEALAIAQLPEASRADASGALAAAQERYRRLGSVDQVGRMDDCLDELVAAVGRARAAAAVTPIGLVRTAREPAEVVVELATRGALEMVTEPLRSLRTLEGQTFRALLATGVVIALALGYAAVTIWSAVYDSNPLFHAFGDYLALFSAALGSGAAGTVLALIGNWQVTGGARSG